ncbi:CopD family protein [Streptomyces sp. CBG33]|uniref:CopD family protein n=1 Tax=Streptomyces sp. CBG33 TaxID=2762624 RepID=UPI001648DE36|nr:CopD family protein [Streptomyces sp. CBG33]
MSFIRPPADGPVGTPRPAEGAASAPGEHGLRPGRVVALPSATGAARALAVVGLLTLGALIPLLGPGAALEGTGEALAPAARPVGVLRTVLFAALCVQAGEVWVARMVPAVRGAPAGLLPRAWSPVAACCGLLAAVALSAIVANGNIWPRTWSELRFGELYGTGDGVLALLEINAFAAAWLLALSRRPGLAALPLAVLVVAEAVRAHPEIETPLLGSALTLVHLTCGALWAGGLLQVLRVLRLWQGHGLRQQGAALLARYARAAAWLFAAVTVTGTLSTLRRMEPHTVLEQLTTTGYGRTLLAKLLLLAVVAVLALRARRRAVAAGDPGAVFAPGRAEVALLGLVVAVSALLTALPVPIRW